MRYSYGHAQSREREREMKVWRGREGEGYAMYSRKDEGSRFVNFLCLCHFEKRGMRL